MELRSLTPVLDGLREVRVTRAELEEDHNLAPLHPSAEALIPEAELWDLTNDCAPIGNDTGADVFQGYRAYRINQSPLNRSHYFRDLLVGWEVKFGGPRARSGAAIQKQLDRDYYPLLTWDDAVIGWAFALLLVDGEADLGTVNSAIAAVERQRGAEVMHFRGWSDPSERLRILEAVANVLERERQRGLARQHKQSNPKDGRRHPTSGCS
jgi:hypothetical protein